MAYLTAINLPNLVDTTQMTFKNNIWLLITTVFFILLLNSSLTAQQSLNMTLAGTWDGNNTQTSGVFYNDIWGYTDEMGNEYAILGSPNEVHFIDVSVPTNPTEILGHVGGSTSLWRDFKTYKKYAYAVADQGNEGLLVFDMSGLPGSLPTLANQITSHFITAHNIFIDVPNGLAYIAGSNSIGSGLIIYDLKVDPVNPPVVFSSSLQGGYIHDIYVRDNIAYASHGNNGFYIHDFTNPSSPVFIDSRNTGGYNHSSWLTDDGQYAVYAEEVPQGRPLGILDLTDVSNNGIGLVTTFKFPLLAPQATGVTPHNPFIAGDYCIVSYYEDGIQIFDISDKNNPFTAAYYDTNPLNTNYTGTDDNWGVYPYFPSGNIIGSDTKNGLFVLSTSLNIPTTCFDGIKNGTELGVDCGGFCKPCPTAPSPPVAGFSANKTTSCIGAISFSDLSAGATSWAWDFGDGNFSAQQNPTHTYTAAGTFTVSLSVTNAVGTDTDTKTNYITISAPAAPIASGSSFCAPGSTTLSATASSGQINWYDNNGNFLTTGPNYTTPTLNTTTTYFAETTTATSPQNVGPLDGSIGGGGYHGASAQYLQFTVNQDLTLVSAWVDADQAGNRTIELQDAFGTLINSVTVNVPNGISRVTLNLNLTPGNYQIGGNNMNLFRNNNGTNYPYSISNLVDITGSTAGSNFYYYLYDWEVQAVGCQSAQVPVIATAQANPVSNFSGSVSGNTVTFTNTSTNSAVWLWDFGDGNNSVLENPSHTFPSGTYTVTLTSSNNCGQNTSSQTFTFGTAPVANFSLSVGSGCAPLSVNFTDLSMNVPSSWSWTFPGGTPTTSTLQNPQVQYSSPGVYDVTLTATNAQGSNSSTQAGVVTVNGAPTSAFTNTVSGLTVTMTNTSTSATSYSWDFGDGNTNTTINPSHTYSTPGTYTIALTATNACGSITTTQTVTVGNSPVASFNSNTSSGCAPITVNFTDQSTGSPTTWSWTFPGGTPATSSLQNPSVTYNTPGVYDVTLTSGNAVGSNTSTQTNYVVVEAIPTANFSFSGNGLSAIFTNTSTNATTYLWDFGDGNTSTMTSPTHTYAIVGTFTVTLTATSSCGSITSTQQVVIGGAAPLPVMASMPNTGCVPLVVNFTDQSSGNPSSWSWDFPGGTPATSTLQNPVVTYTALGAYDVTLTVSNAFGSNSSTYFNHILANDAPNTNFIFSVTGNNAMFTNTTFSGNTYLWDFGDGTTSTQANPTHTYTNNGTYTVTLTATNACGSSVHTETITISVGTSNEATNNITGLTVKPNPNNGVFQLEISGKPSEQLELQVLNVVGIKVYERSLDFSSGVLSTGIDLGQMPAGTYILAVRRGADVIYRKLAIIE